ncbi:hypothetical protein [Paraburkholderia fungorum]|nr:hypothetical protein [Paraburkholderia fungorum]
MQKSEALLTTAAPLSLKNAYGDLGQPQVAPQQGTAAATGYINPDDRKNYVGAVLADSANKCDVFVGSLSAGQRINDLTFDFLTTTLNAVATVFTPVTTIHALTAGATVSTGSKLAINQDVYQKETAQLLVQAIDATYYKDYADYAKQLEGAKDPTQISPPLEVANIETFHRECSLDRALTYVLANQPKAVQTSVPGPQSSTPKPAVKAEDVTQGAHFMLGDGTVYVVTQPPSAANNQTVQFLMLPSKGVTPSGTQSAPIDMFTKVISGP